MRKTIIGLLVLATLGTVALWAFAFFGDPYTKEWDLTDRLWCRLVLAWGRCEVGVTRISLPLEWTNRSSRLDEAMMAALRQTEKILDDGYRQVSLSFPQSYLPTTFGFGWEDRVEAATANFPGSSRMVRGVSLVGVAGPRRRTEHLSSRRVHSPISPGTATAKRLVPILWLRPHRKRLGAVSGVRKGSSDRRGIVMTGMELAEIRQVTVTHYPLSLGAVVVASAVVIGLLWYVRRRKRD